MGGVHGCIFVVVAERRESKRERGGERESEREKQRNRETERERKREKERERWEEVGRAEQRESGSDISTCT